jgi:hypothetical protein
MMNPKDAIRIARFHKIGMCYNQDEQLMHGGMIFKTGRQIPFYNPDHGPTYDAIEALPHIPEHLIPITERWLDPHFGLITATVIQPSATSTEQQEDMDEEEVMRQAAAERLFMKVPELVAEKESELEELRLDKEDLEMRRLKKLKRMEMNFDHDPESLDEEKETKPEELQFDRPTRRMQEKVALGYARDPRTLITYTIDTIREMSEEIALAEKDIEAKKK